MWVRCTCRSVADTGRSIMSCHVTSGCRQVRVVEHCVQSPYSFSVPIQLLRMLIADVQALAAWADFLVVATPGGPQTRYLVDAPVLDALGPNGYLVNIARGSVVDTVALARALAQGTRARFALGPAGGPCRPEMVRGGRERWCSAGPLELIRDGRVSREAHSRVAHGLR